jgi:hypothetical protein
LLTEVGLLRTDRLLLRPMIGSDVERFLVRALTAGALRSIPALMKVLRACGFQKVQSEAQASGGRPVGLLIASSRHAGLTR